MLKLYWDYANYNSFHMVEHIGQTIDGLKVTPSLIVAGNHVLGIGKMRDFLDGDLDLSSGMHTYLSGLSGFELPFVKGSGDGDHRSGTRRRCRRCPTTRSSAPSSTNSTIFSRRAKRSTSGRSTPTRRSRATSFTFDGATPNGADGHIFYKENLKKGTTMVEVDYGSSEFQVVLKGVNHDLSKSDFIL